MKTVKPILLVLSMLAPLSNGQAVRKDGLPFRDVASSSPGTSGSGGSSFKDPMLKFEQTEGDDPSVANNVGNLLENSELITFNGETTLVPKNAIIKTPEKFTDRINNHKEGAKIVGWLDFLASNGGWITTIEVTLAQAKGEDPVSPDLMETVSKNGNLLVAVLKGGPISILPPKVTGSAAPTENTPQK